MFVGTVPELEMAIYSICFITRLAEDCDMQFLGEQFTARDNNIYHLT
jgi:hypothetical protein